MFNRPSSGVRSFALVLLLLTALVACGGGSAGTSAGPAASAGEPATGPAGSGRVSFGVVGDSLTAGEAPLQGTSVRGLGSWLPAALGEPLDFRGGWAVPGATAADMAEGVDAVDADVLVVLAGTNDLLAGHRWPEVRNELLAAVRRTGVDDVLLVAVPPLDQRPGAVAPFNRRLAGLAEEEGWQLVDPWAEIRVGDGWAAGASSDGIHPRQPVADRAGEVIRAAVLDRVAGAAGAPG